MGHSVIEVQCEERVLTIVLEHVDGDLCSVRGK